MSGRSYNPPRGMRDIVLGEAETYEYVFNEFRRIALLHGFAPIITPTLEFFRLFAEKSGEEIKKSMYVFEDKAGRLLALRPEVTASIVRVFLRKLRGEIRPIKLYYVSQCFRYEEPQRGRYREFWQGGLEVIGVQDISGDLEAAYTASRFLEAVGVRHMYIVGNVAFHRAIMDKFNVAEEVQEHVLHLLDKRMIDEAMKVLAGISGELVEIYKSFISKKHSEIPSFIEEMKPFFGDKYDALLSEAKRLSEFIDSLRELGYRAVYDPYLVRGLAYYTGLIYEYKAEEGGLEISIGGGGRYDGLSTVYGGPFEYFTGLALGLDRVILVLEKKPRLVGSGIVVIGLKGVRLVDVLGVKRILEEYGLSSTVIYGKKISKALSIADRKGYRFAVIVGRRELESGRVTLKDLRKGVQETVAIDVLPLYIYSVVN